MCVCVCKELTRDHLGLARHSGRHHHNGEGGIVVFERGGGGGGGKVGEGGRLKETKLKLQLLLLY